MNASTFRHKLEEGQSIDFAYEDNGLAGVIAVWRHDSRYVLTWEECSSGDEFNESSYTRDERHEFETLDDVLEFLNSHRLNVESWKGDSVGKSEE